MTTETNIELAKINRAARVNNAKRLGKFLALRIVMLFLTIVVGIYITILIANMGGYVDTIMRNEIRERVNQQVAAMTASEPMSTEGRSDLVEQMIDIEETRLGLDTPFVLRSFRFLGNALTLNLGRAVHMVSDHGSRAVRNIILERLPATLLLTGVSQLFLFFSTVFLALMLSRHYGSFWDKLIITLSPTSSAPPWFYGIFLILLFAAVLKILPFSGMVSAPPPKETGAYILDVLKHLILPASSLILSSFFISIYNWRTFFLIYSSEDYVDMAKAKGLPSRDIERRYILRPTLPTIITNFALIIIGLFTGATITETVFLWPGLGRTIFRAISLYDTPVIVGTTIIYAYLLAFTVFFLDFIYAIVDPRVKVGGGNS
ncbi:MAG: ABC transporter permease [Chloroflexi bacterium]|jgi:peptide/nickel transport system permease protein|nr:ABC transporter permease [Chloroflexota bacterium]